MILINNISDTQFSFNGITYFKNFTPFVSGNKISIINTYDGCIQLTNFPTIYSDFVVNGITYGSVTALQDALLPILFSRTSLTDLSYLVPYTGATGNVNLGEYGLKAGNFQFDITPTGIPTALGTMYWDTFYRTLSLIDGDGDTTLQIGQEQRTLIHNNTGATLTDGQVVYITGSTGELPTVSLANASSEGTSAATLGVVTESIAHGAAGFITDSGIVHGLNTLAFNEGDMLWLGTTAGTFTNVKPTSPNHLVLIGYVVKKAGGNGSIKVKIQNTQELDECSDVLFSGLANNNVLTWESATSLWKNKSLSTILGYTAANDANVVHLSGTETITGLKTFSSALTASSIIKSGGTSSQFLKADGSVDSTSYQPLLTNPITGTGTTNYLPKATGTTTLGNSLIYDNGSNIGVNTTSPNFQTAGRTLLDINGSSQAGLGLSIGTNPAYYIIAASSVTEMASITQPLAFTVNGAERIRIASSGNVGIGTTSPTSKLHVAGLSSFADNAAAIAGGLTVGAFYHTSGTLKVVI